MNETSTKQYSHVADLYRQPPFLQSPFLVWNFLNDSNQSKAKTAELKHPTKVASFKLSFETNMGRKTESRIISPGSF